MAISHINTECKRYGCFKNLLACYANCRYNTRCEELRNEISDKTEEATKDINSYLAERGAVPVVIQFPKKGLKFVASAKPQAMPAKAAVTPIRSLHQVKEAKKPGRASARPKAAIVAAPKPRPVKSPAKIATISRKVKPRAVSKAISPGLEAVSDRRPARSKTTPKRERVNSPATRHKSRRRKPTMPRTRQTQSINEETITKATTPEPVTTANGAEAPKKAARNRKKNTNQAGAQNGQGSQLFIILKGNRASVVDEMGLMRHVLQNPAAEARYFKATEIVARVQITEK